MLATAVAVSAATGRVPRDSPACARSGTRPVFLSPSGEPFRAEPNQPYPSALWFDRADSNHDGVLTRDEMIADAGRFFATLDKDHDGRLTPDEVDAYERDVAPETALYSVRSFDPYSQPRRRSRDRDAMAQSYDYGGPMGAGRYTWLNIPEPVAAADQDMDRVITRKEFEQAAGIAFDRLDGSGRGKVRLAELARTPAQIAIEGPCRPSQRANRDGEDRP